MKNVTKDSTSKKVGPSIKLSAEIGTEMQVEITNSGNRIKLVLIGIVPDQYLLFRIPENLSSAKALKAFTVDTAINIRGISRGIAFGFNSIILGATTEPDTLLFVNYPKQIQQQSIRKTQRVKCLLPASLNQDTTSIKGTIADLSCSGCHFQTQESLLTADQINILQPDTYIKVAISLPAVEGKKYISAQIKNTFTDAEKAHIGIQFTKIEETTKNLIENMVNMSFDLPPF